MGMVPRSLPKSAQPILNTTRARTPRMFTRYRPRWRPTACLRIEANNEGKSACLSAHPTGFWCGTITNTDWSGADDQGVINDHIRVATYCTEGGDSGGPVFYGNMAKGLSKGFFDGKPSPCSSAYTHVWEAERGLGVTVFTGS